MKLTVSAVFLFFIILISVETALGCQYTEVKSYDINVNHAYNRNTSALLIDPVISNVKQGVFEAVAPPGQAAPRFDLNNPNDISLKFNLHYRFSSCAGGLHKIELTLTAHEQKTIAEYYNPGCSGGDPHIIIDQSSFKFEYIDTESVYNKWDKVTINNDVCKQCPAGSSFTCLDDGQPADSDIKCGSGKRNILGICTQGSIYVIGDGKCSTEIEENCKVSPDDCKPKTFYKCDNNGKEVPNKEGVGPNGSDVCQGEGEWRATKVKEINQPCGCDFECKDNLICGSGLCKPDQTNPPKGEFYCPNIKNFEKVATLEINQPCSCDLQCKEGVCYQGTCQKLMEPKIKCPSGTDVKRDESLTCNIYASNTKLARDVQTTFVLEAGNGLSFYSSEGCQNIKGNQCIGTFNVGDLSNEGLSVGLNTNTAGDSDITGKITFRYNNKAITEIVPLVKIHVGTCGDKIVDIWETKENCCTDVGVKENRLWDFTCEQCRDGVFIEYRCNMYYFLIAGLVIPLLFFIGLLYKAYPRTHVENKNNRYHVDEKYRREKVN